MNKTSLMVRGSALTLALFSAMPAMAQSEAAPAQDTVDTAADGAIVVTGSRIRRDEFSVAEPITVITAEEITQAGFNSAADALQS
ncbi:MAG: hypothetical protein Q7T60_06150, partial [Sphingopyxis sp.]|nr:hypothetical protein [Sphingopyxis sp.]